MLDRQKGNIIFECDTCADTLDTGTGSFDAALNQLRRDGWRAQLVAGEWVHWCQKCWRKS